MSLQVIPVSESMERDLILDQGDFCRLEANETLDMCLDNILTRLQKHTSRKERFLEGRFSLHSTTTQH